MSFHFLLRPLKSLSFAMNSNECTTTTREQPENCEKEQSNDFQMIYNKKINKKSSIINITAAGILNERKGFQTFSSLCRHRLSPHTYGKKKES